jgi:hypothetical protein
VEVRSINYAIVACTHAGGYLRPSEIAFRNLTANQTTPPPHGNYAVPVIEHTLRPDSSEKCGLAIHQRWLGESEQSDKWFPCLNAALMPRGRREHVETITAEP